MKIWVNLPGANQSIICRRGMLCWKEFSGSQSRRGASSISKARFTLRLWANTDTDVLRHSCHSISNSYFIINRKIANLSVIISARVKLFLSLLSTRFLSLNFEQKATEIQIGNIYHSGASSCAPRNSRQQWRFIFIAFSRKRSVDFIRQQSCSSSFSMIGKYFY